MKCLLATTMLAALLVPAAAGQTYTFSTPTDDRWQYPFNFSGGTRTTASCFSSLGTGVPSFANFNDRDGVLIAAWNTAAQITPGQGASAYNIQSIRFTLTNEPGALWYIDLTPDEWYTYDYNNDGAVNGDGIPRGAAGDIDGESSDADPGRPLELFGTGFGPVYDSTSWNENSAYYGGRDTGNLPRDPFPFAYASDHVTQLHCEDSVKGLHNPGMGSFTPTPWAVGVPVGYTPGGQTTAFEIDFEIDLSLSGGAVRAYFQDQLNQGRLFSYITSLADTQQFGDPAGVPSLYNKEAVSGGIPGAQSPKLIIVLAQGIDGDLDGNGCVDITDLAVLLGHFGTASGAQLGDGDIDGDGDVDLTDLAALLSHFGAGSC
ncbi:MAG: hypothetical protein HZB38_00250 [Planctomycetes bacterium]|nr:hypothetical protein [Planctomycetota bacterium]